MKHLSDKEQPMELARAIAAAKQAEFVLLPESTCPTCGEEPAKAADWRIMQRENKRHERAARDALQKLSWLQYERETEKLRYEYAQRQMQRKIDVQRRALARLHAEVFTLKEQFKETTVEG